ncbi:alpha/beta fold hydrolase [Streptomyces noursei]|uniref:alpha/beta fold hydrolase n=1 Tax=Streptomyces noursei TaxID=1971 RepID=UPI0015E11E81|nr:alpha/beta fold hydrolase [Streptomyces noursei]
MSALPQQKLLPHCLNGPHGRLAYVDEGPSRATATPLVLIHGWGADLHDWDATVERFRTRSRVIALDLRGHGSSGPSTSDYRPATLAADVVRLLDERGVAAPAVVVGHSLGAVVASVVAAEAGDRVAGLLVLDPAYGRPEGHRDRVRPWLEQLRTDPTELAPDLVAGSVDRTHHPELRAYLRDRVRRTDPEVMRRTLADLHMPAESFSSEPASSRYLVRRTQPVLALNRDRSRARWEAGLLAGPPSRSLVWEDCGHFIHLEAPERFHTLLEQWLALLDGVGEETFTFGSDVVRAGGGT